MDILFILVAVAVLAIIITPFIIRVRRLHYDNPADVLSPLVTESDVAEELHAPIGDTPTVPRYEYRVRPGKPWRSADHVTSTRDGRATMVNGHIRKQLRNVRVNF